MRRQNGLRSSRQKAAIIQELRQEGHPLKYLLKFSGLAKSTYYYELKRTDRVEERNKSITETICHIFEENKQRYGVRRVCHELVNRGFHINHKRVQRIMHDLKLFGKRPKEKYHSYKGEVGKVAGNIIQRNFKADRPLQKWTTDVTQFHFSWGKCYLSPSWI